MEEMHITILPRMSVGLAKFVKSRHGESTFYAHPNTIKAMKKDAFSTKDLVHADVSVCAHCQQILHAGLWNYCPFCGCP